METRDSEHTDKEGYYSLECPFCSEQFKGFARDINSKEVIDLFCPSCGLCSYKENFQPHIKLEKPVKVTLNDLREKLPTLKRVYGVEGKEQKTELYKVTSNLESTQENYNLETIEMICCNRKIKIGAKEKRTSVFCPYCGVK
ncbi:hypothetical protein GLW03_12985 [Halobacillus halophilus]|uniref:hypothetical protein n=1 Tax=Halobacillus halophilus TaxID=1570 RepID=UPI00136E62FD|nr:hypothetical protein [Halobacillus halophilus]MYL30741.1 hypothetical protein [Halobacillus halophilus]